MSGIYGYSREAVRVKVKKCESNASPEWRKFSVDPQITSLEVLYSILAKAFDIRSDFSISYRAFDPSGQETYLGVLSDWDLDAAFLRAHNTSIQTGNEPCLNLRVDIKAFSEAQDWEVNSPATKEISALQQSIDAGQKYVQNMQNKLPGLIMNHMEKTFSMVQRALNLTEEQLPAQPPRPPLCDSEFRNFLDSVGQILYPNELRKVIFAGGIDPSLRRVVWKHILNVYPNGMTGRERMDYMKRKAAEYYRLRDTWRMAVQKGPVIGELAYVTSMVRKDVLRTDRLHPFYAGSDDNQNIASLFNILTTYALNHPSVSYCQGMSDIASPLLVTMGDEAHAYICFCAIMTRLKVNFMLDGIAMTQKFTHLAEALQFYDPEFFEYLKSQQADDLLFCYRWLLLEMKREFAFEDSLRMLEVLWSSIRSEPPAKELDLFEKEFEPPAADVPAPKSPSIIMRTPRENAYTKVCALRRQSSSVSSLSCSPNQSSSPGLFLPLNKLNVAKRMNQSLDENISRNPRVKRVPKSHQSLDETKMLMLMENIAFFKDSSDDQSDSVFENPESDDDIDLPPTANPTIAEQIVFHPTNPFLSDAQEDGKNQNEVDKAELDNSPNIANNNNESPTVSPKRELRANQSGKSLKTKIGGKALFSTSPGNIISKQFSSHKKGGHFKELKEKIAASKKGILASIDKMDNQSVNAAGGNKSNQVLTGGQQTTSEDKDASSQQRKPPNKVKNLNELLNFSSMNKSRISDKLVTSSKANFEKRESIEHSGKHRPLIKLTKNSFDDSDSSTLDGNSVSSTQSHPPGKPPPLQLQLTNIVAQTQMSLDGSSPDDSQDYYPMTTSMTRELRLEMESLDRQVFGDASIIERSKLLQDASEIGYEKLDKDSLDLVEVRESEIVPIAEINDLIVMRNSERKHKVDPLNRISVCSTNTDVFVWENPLHQMSGASSCNFNEVVETNDEEILMKGYVNGSVETEATVITNAMTPDEQQDLEYDGDIVIECSGENMKKSVTPLRLVQQKPNISRLRDDSDSDTTDSWKNQPINPFLPPKSISQELIENTFADTQTMVTSLPAGLDAQLPLQTQSFAPGTRPLGCEEASEANISFSKPSNTILPSPSEFGGGNAFLMFLCLTLLLQHRNFVMKSGMDYNEMAMHFDKMVRKHDVTRVLNQARRMYADYLKTQSAIASAAGDAATKS
ncbi:unnamed protein product [Hermetia illucens]|uniref:Rab-GAP TBC domain-containing protein n=1 Tax=Hermetia illucens TaxID=343691 RepID=A0A7R8UTI9_HERIL|nr:uncharacterized protein LOC119651901 [Hermetia illucens]CAD7086365.1 unnamed protein product [Hermetia illucens]